MAGGGAGSPSPTLNAWALFKTSPMPSGGAKAWAVGVLAASRTAVSWGSVSPGLHQQGQHSTLNLAQAPAETLAC